MVYSMFNLETEKGILEEILKGQVDLQTSPWPSISIGAKDLIKKMLTVDPKKRITAAEALGQYSFCFIIIFKYFFLLFRNICHFRFLLMH